MKSTLITITVTLDEAHAYHLAQFLKRVSYTTCERLSDPTDPKEPAYMIGGLETIRHALAEKGVAPR